MRAAKAVTRIRHKYRVVAPELDERRRRQWAAAEAREVGWGGVSVVARVTGLSRPTILAGVRELELPASQRAAAAQRIRRPGGGRRAVTVTDPTLLAALMAVDRTHHAGPPRIAVALDL